MSGGGGAAILSCGWPVGTWRPATITGRGGSRVDESKVTTFPNLTPADLSPGFGAFTHPMCMLPQPSLRVSELHASSGCGYDVVKVLTLAASGP